MSFRRQKLLYARYVQNIFPLRDHLPICRQFDCRHRHRLSSLSCCHFLVYLWIIYYQTYMRMALTTELDTNIWKHTQANEQKWYEYSMSMSKYEKKAHSVETSREHTRRKKSVFSYSPCKFPLFWGILICLGTSRLSMHCASLGQNYFLSIVIYFDYYD